MIYLTYLSYKEIVKPLVCFTRRNEAELYCEKFNNIIDIISSKMTITMVYDFLCSNFDQESDRISGLYEYVMTEFDITIADSIEDDITYESLWEVISTVSEINYSGLTFVSYQEIKLVG